MPQVAQKKCRAVIVWNRYSVSAPAPATRRKRASGTLTISALRRRQIEQSHSVSSGKSVSISNTTAPQWQLPRYVASGRVPGGSMAAGGAARI
jgi:hypothetical protein